MRIVLRLLLGATLALTVASASAASILFVVQENGAAIETDRKVEAHLASLGHRVTRVDQRADPSQAKGQDLVVLSSTVAAKDVNPGWRFVEVPLLTWENDLLDDLAMTGKRHDVDFGTVPKERHLWIVNAPHPMAAGLRAGIADVYVKQAPMSWGKPGLGAITIVTVYGQPEKAAIFAYEKGATMDYESLAPARRAMVFLDNDTFTNLSPAGLRLFDAAIAWTLGAN